MDFLEEVELVLRADPDRLLGETGGAPWAKKWRRGTIVPGEAMRKPCSLLLKETGVRGGLA